MGWFRQVREFFTRGIGARDVADAMVRVAEVVDRYDKPRFTARFRELAAELIKNDSPEVRAEILWMMPTGWGGLSDFYAIHPDGTPDSERSRRYHDDLGIIVFYVDRRPLSRLASWMGGAPPPPRSEEGPGSASSSGGV